MTYDATLRNLERLGEAATRIPRSVQDAATEIPWRQTVATGDRLIHAFLGIDKDTRWSIIRDDLPSLLRAIRQVREEHADR